MTNIKNFIGRREDAVDDYDDEEELDEYAKEAAAEYEREAYEIEQEEAKKKFEQEAMQKVTVAIINSEDYCFVSYNPEMTDKKDWIKCLDCDQPCELVEVEE